MATIALPPTITLTGATLTWNPANPTTGTPTPNTYYGYCTVAQVQWEFTTNLRALTTQLDVASIAEQITLSAIELQKQIEHFYVMPYAGSDPNILSTLMFLNRRLAFARLYDRFFAASEPDSSPAAAKAHEEVQLKIMDIVNGAEQWGPGFGDAVPQAMAPVYDLSKGASITPSPNDADPNVANPIFSISNKTRYRGTDII